MSKINVSYMLAIGASAADVAELVDRIHKDFGITATPLAVGTITPQQVADDDDDNGPANTAEVDSRGFPHDPRIHSGKKTLNKGDGTWRYLKGLQETTKLAVEAELRAVMGNTGTVAVTAPTPVIAAPVNPAPAVTLTVTAPVVATPYTTFVDWLARNTAPSEVQGQQLNPEWVEQQFVANGLTGGVAALANNFPLCDAFREAFEGVITGAGLQPR